MKKLIHLISLYQLIRKVKVLNLLLLITILCLNACKVEDISTDAPLPVNKSMFLRDGVTVYSLNPSDGTEIWKNNLAGSGYPTYINQRLYYNSGLGYFLGFLHAIDANTGQTIWLNNDRTSTMGNSPLLTDQKLIFSHNSRNVAALNPENGEVSWTYQLPMMRTIANMIVKPSVIVVYDYSVIVGLNPSTGQEIWRLRENNISHFYPNLTTDETIFFKKGTNTVAAIDIKKGVVKWSFENQQYPLITKYSALYKNKLCFVSVYSQSQQNNHTRFLILNEADGTIAHEIPAFSAPIYISPILDENHLYYTDGNKSTYAIDLSTKKMIWKKDSKEGVSLFFNKYNDVILATDFKLNPTDPKFYGIDTKTGNIIFELNLDNNFGSPNPLIANNILYIYLFSEKKLVAIEITTGRRIWEKSVSSPSQVYSFVIDSQNQFYYSQFIDF